MRGYISSEGGSDKRIPLDSKVEIYRDPDRSHEVVVETTSNEIPLGVSDITVSRKKNGEPPVTIAPGTEFIEVRNRNNANGVSVRAEGEGFRENLNEGEVATVRRDSIIELGYQASLQLVVERERKQVIQHEGEGDVEFVQGDKLDVSTDINDAVINRSDIGGGSSPDGEEAGVPSGEVDASTSVEDAVVNNSSVGTVDDDSDATETKKICEVHEVAYRGSECPRCASGGADDTGPGATPADTPSETSETNAETKYCRHCGTEISRSAAYCPDCGGLQQ